MGNLAQSMAGKVDARVMRPDGTIAEYRYPIQVALLMTLHPDHLVVRCSPGPVAPGGTRKIRVLDLEDRLALGEFYIMYPIPSEYKQVFFQTGTPGRTERMTSPCHSNLKPNVARGTSRTKIIDGRRRRRVKIIARSFFSLFSRRSVARRKIKEGGGQVPLLAFDRDDSSFSSSAYEKVEAQKPEITIQSPCWKPELDDIPEFQGLPSAGPKTGPGLGPGIAEKNATTPSPTVATRVDHNRGAQGSLWEDL